MYFMVMNKLYLEDLKMTFKFLVHRLHETPKRYNLKTLVNKTKNYGVCGKITNRCKLVINESIVERVSNFNYLGILIKPATL